MKSNEFITESKAALGALLKQAKYRPTTDSHFPRNDGQETRVRKLESLIKDAGYNRSKSDQGGEYVYEYNVDGTRVIFNYRMGDTGLIAWWTLQGVNEDVITESIKGQGTQALRKVLADFGLVTRGNVYSDKRKNGRRVKATVFIENPKPKTMFDRYRTPKKSEMPSQQELDASVARHFGGLNVIKSVSHLRDTNLRYNDLSYIAVAFTE